MEGKYVAGALAGLLAAGPATDAAKSAYDRFFAKKQGIEQNFQSPQKNGGLEQFLGGVAYAQGEAHASVDYASLAKQAESIGAYKNPDMVIELLNPYRNAPDNNSSAFYTDLGVAYGRKGMYMKDKNLKMEATQFFEEAIVLSKKAIELQPGNVSPHYNLGIIYFTIGKKDDAISEFRAALRYDINHEKSKIMLKRLTSN